MAQQHEAAVVITRIQRRYHGGCLEREAHVADEFGIGRAFEIADLGIGGVDVQQAVDPADVIVFTRSP